MIWLVHLIYSAVGFALCYNYVILNYCIRFAVLPCVRLCLNSCLSLWSRLHMLCQKSTSTHLHLATEYRANTYNARRSRPVSVFYIYNFSRSQLMLLRGAPFNVSGGRDMMPLAKISDGGSPRTRSRRL